jgi:hypothetical protein
MCAKGMLFVCSYMKLYVSEVEVGGIHGTRLQRIRYLYYV